MESITEAQQSQLWKTAQQAYQNSYAPYSQFPVGAALLTQQGNIFAGCNVENISYGLTICAERNAIASAVAAEGGQQMKIQAVAIANKRQIPCSPCGACRQVIAEFADKNTIVIFLGQKGVEISTLAELLPQGFSF
ncbi:cytidine deaminase [Xenococcus sp. PCC 7305]|uniref:cytidine deaminase n=1 Tax=Xenococcus sp. PCC 7305 TaxID=102125 RepID=UPI0002AC2F31|nr:cytidine deaminase [Xenococcus sp. PCC 7305]ELS03190.1 cytidine deaminase [Xenococcus sp. PCC 7305]